MTCQVWLTARNPHTLESEATLRIFASADRLIAERIIETAQMNYSKQIYNLRQLVPNAIVSIDMRYPKPGMTNQLERLEQAQEVLAKIRAKKIERYALHGTPRSSGA